MIRWHWDDQYQCVWIIERIRDSRRRILENRILLTKEQIAKLAKNIQEKDEGSL